MSVFDLSRRFAWLESATGPVAAELIRVAAQGRTRACPRCEWRMMAWERTCENCGGEVEPLLASRTDRVELPRPETTLDTSVFCSEPALLARTCARFEAAQSAVPTRVALCMGPRRFRAEAARWLEAFERLHSNESIDVLCGTRSAPRWAREIPHATVCTTRGLASRSLPRDGAVLLIDSRSARSPSTATHRAVAASWHRRILARIPPAKFASPEAVFAVTDLVAPGTFSSLREARSLHREHRHEFLRRRDQVISRTLPSKPLLHLDASLEETSAVPIRRAWLVAFTREACDRTTTLATIVNTVEGENRMASSAYFDSLAKTMPLDRVACTPPQEAVEDLIRGDTSSAARLLASDVARLARAYATRIDSAPRTRRVALADEFSARFGITLRRGTLRVCIAVLASVTIPGHAS